MSYNIKDYNKNQARSSYLVFFAFGFFMLTLLYNLIKLTAQYLNRRALLTQQRKEVEDLRARNEYLKYSIKRADTEEYIEQKARKLTMGRDDEYTLLAAYPPPTPHPSATPRDL